MRLSPRAFDVTLVALLTAATQAEAWLGPFGDRVALSGFLLGATLPLLLRRRRPLGSCLGAVLSFVAGQAVLGTTTEMASGTLPVLVAIGSGAAYLSAREAYGFGAAALAAVWVSVAASPEPPTPSNYLYATLLVVVAWSVGRVLSGRHAQLALVQEQARVATEDAISRERAQIARELHDVVAHGVSVMVLQAGAAKEVLHSRPDDARAALESVQESGRSALVELRRMLDVLREDDPELGLQPQPGLQDLPALVARTTAAGLQTDLTVDTGASAVPAAVGLSAYRIVQEALTNALKHAGPATASVSVGVEADTLVLAVSDTGQGADPRHAPGYGLVGMRERVSIFGGDLVCSSGPGFSVRARLPLGASA